MYYRVDLNNLNVLIKAVIKLNNKLRELNIKIYYNNINSKTRLYYRWKSYYNG